ncbi:MAG: 2-C-methyl-D-erythritol 2,4-cyclodiphosphate synthase, partial [Bacteroidales bacterium]
MNIRIGQGIDFHRLVDDRDLWLGGVNIPSDRGSLAHSDGDVLLHAICDAILGAAGMRDIGYHFPDTDPSYKNIDSKILLKKSIDIVAKKGYRVINIDSTVCLDKPKISAFVPEMCKQISSIAGIELDNVSVKATTTEGLGFTGRREGIVA